MNDTLPAIDLDKEAWAVREAIALSNADPSATDDHAWQTAYVKHLEEARRRAGLPS